MDAEAKKLLKDNTAATRDLTKVVRALLKATGEKPQAEQFVQGREERLAKLAGKLV